MNKFFKNMLHDVINAPRVLYATTAFFNGIAIGGSNSNTPIFYIIGVAIISLIGLWFCLYMDWNYPINEGEKECET